MLNSAVTKSAVCYCAEDMTFEHVMSNPRLLTSWCWRERFPAFSPTAPADAESLGLRQELLLGFDVSDNCEHSVLSMRVEKEREADASGSQWSVSLQASL